MNTLADRLKAEIERCGYTQEQLAKKAGMAQPSINKLVTGKAHESRKIAKIADALGVDTHWLATGEGHKFSKSKHLIREDRPTWANGFENNTEPAPVMNTYAQVPVVGKAQLGDNGHWTEIDMPVGHGDGYVNYPTNDPNAYALRCVGDSMRPRIKDGEFVVIEPNSEPIPGDEVLVKAKDGRVMVKVMLYKRDGKLHLISINENHPPQSIPLDEVEKIHPVVGIMKKAAWLKDN